MAVKVPFLLRPYEEDALRDLYAALKLHRCVLFVLPTGGGKTVVAGRYCEQQIRAGQRGLVIVHTVELLEQMVATLQRFGLEEHEIGVVWRDDERTNPTAPMQVATIDTLRRRSKPHADFVVVDEADLCLAPKWVTVLHGWYRDAKVLGLTATPMRLDGKPMRTMFDEMVEGPSVAELCELKDDEGRPYLLPPRCFVPVRERLIDTDGLRVKMGDWEHGELEKRACATWVLAGVTKWMRELGEDRNGFVFACGVKHVYKLCEQINADRRFDARPLTGATPKSERRDLLKPRGWLATGKRRVVVTCDVVSRGYDLPSAKLVVMARPTCSEALYRHQVGRILRPTTKNEHQPLVLDLTRNVLRFGRPQDPRAKPWSLDAEPVARGLALKQPAPRAKQCEACGTINPIGATFCEHCAAEFPTRLPEEIGGLLVEFDPGQRQAICIGRHDGTPCRWAAPLPGRKMTPREVAARGGRPWRCRRCFQIEESALSPQTICAGSPDGPCPGACPVPRKERTARRVARREQLRGADPQWRCHACAMLNKLKAPSEFRVCGACGNRIGNEAAKRAFQRGVKATCAKCLTKPGRPPSENRPHAFVDEQALSPQLVCAGMKGTPCPNATPMPRKERVARRDGTRPEWRCVDCVRRRIANDVCAGSQGACRNGENGLPKLAGYGANSPSRLAERGGQPWRCKACAIEVRRTNRKKELDRAQTYCAGSVYGPCTKGSGGSPARSPIGAFTATVVARRGGPWRCMSCARFVQLECKRGHKLPAPDANGKRACVQCRRETEKERRKRAAVPPRTPAQLSAAVSKAWETRRSRAKENEKEKPE